MEKSSVDWFDHVFIRKSKWGHNKITKKEFHAIPIREREELIQNGDVIFIKDGEVVGVGNKK